MFSDRSKAVLLLWIICVIYVLSIPDLCPLSYFVFVMLSHLCVAALWSPAGKGLTSWLLFVISNCTFVTFFGILGQMWYLIVLNPDLCPLSYFNAYKTSMCLDSHLN